MLNVACISLDNLVLKKFYNSAVNINYFDNLYIRYSIYDIVVILNTNRNKNIILSLEYVEKVFKKSIYLVDINYEENSINNIFSYNIKDYLAYPISGVYLINRIINDYNLTEHFTRFEYKGLRVNYITHEVIVDGRLVHLTKKEYQILKLLSENFNAPVKKDMILLLIWGGEDSYYNQTLQAHIKTLRFKLGPYRTNLITVWKRGYSLVKFD